MGVPMPPIMEAAVEVVREKPLERVQNRTQQPIVDSPVPQFMEAAVKNRFPKPIVDSTAPQIMEAVVESCVGEQIVDSPVPQFMEAAVENCVGEQIVDCPVPQIMEAVWPSTPRERVQNRTPELVMDPPVPQLKEATLPSTPQKRLLNRTQEQIVGVPVPLIMEAPVDVVLSYTTGARSESHAGADCRLPCASEHGRFHRGACSIVFRSRLWTCWCPTSSRMVCLLFLQSSRCTLVKCSL